MATSMGTNASDFERVRKADHPLNEAGNVAAERAGSAAEQISKGAENAMQTASTAMQSVKDRSSEAMNQASDVAGNFRQALENSARNQPGTTVLMALAAGFLVGAFWRTGGSSN